MLDSADLVGNTQAVFTLTLVAGLVMAAFGVLKLGKIVNYVSNSVMAGFVMGVAVLITVGKFDDIFGSKTTSPDTTRLASRTRSSRPWTSSSIR